MYVLIFCLTIVCMSAGLSMVFIAQNKREKKIYPDVFFCVKGKSNKREKKVKNRSQDRGGE